MGTQNALQALLARAQALGLSLRLTDTYYADDELADLGRLAAVATAALCSPRQALDGK
jgi:hypothetical protein